MRRSWIYIKSLAERRDTHTWNVEMYMTDMVKENKQSVPHNPVREGRIRSCHGSFTYIITLS